MIGRLLGDLFKNFFDALLHRVFGLIRALMGGLMRAPLTAVENAVQPIDIRRASPDDVIDVRHAVLRPGRPRDSAVFDGDTAPTTRHWAAERSGIVVGVVTVVAAPLPLDMAEPPRWQLRGLAVLPEYRGSGLGSALLRTTHTEVGEPLWCNARKAVVPFYVAHGWRPVGPVFDIPDVGPHQRMVWPGP